MEQIQTSETEQKWYVLRCYHGKEVPYGERIRTAFGVECYVPQEKVRQKGVQGRFVWVEHSVLPGYIFVRTDKDVLHQISVQMPSVRKMVCRSDEGLYVPVVIREKAMRDFIGVSGTKEQQALYFDPAKLKLKPNDRVRVIGGPFVGMEGYFVQIGSKHEKRLIIRLENLIAVATAAIPASLVERI